MEESLNQFFGLDMRSVITVRDVGWALFGLGAVAVFWQIDKRKGAEAVARRGALGYFVIWLQYFFGIHALFSGANYFLNPERQMVLTHELTGPFQAALDALGLFAVVKVIETVVGLCLILNIFVPLAAIFEMPVSVVIFYLSVIVDPDQRSIWTGSKELIINVVLLLAYFGYFRPIFRLKLEWRPIWRKFGAE
ncbi:MAG: hypothetical protein JNJ73_21020 [Hyphomonadaceae bacterium]|nr:hypothetical protein [Hyphomonadaceae bacterium]